MRALPGILLYIPPGILHTIYSDILSAIRPETPSRIHKGKPRIQAETFPVLFFRGYTRTISSRITPDISPWIPPRINARIPSGSLLEESGNSPGIPPVISSI